MTGLKRMKAKMASWFRGAVAGQSGLDSLQGGTAQTGQRNRSRRKRDSVREREGELRVGQSFKGGRSLYARR